MLILDELKARPDKRGSVDEGNLAKRIKGMSMAYGGGGLGN